MTIKISNKLILLLYKATQNKSLTARILKTNLSLVFGRLKKMDKKITKEDYIDVICEINEDIENPQMVGKLLRESYKKDFKKYYEQESISITDSRTDG